MIKKWSCPSLFCENTWKTQFQTKTRISRRSTCSKRIRLKSFTTWLWFRAMWICGNSFAQTGRRSSTMSSCITLPSTWFSRAKLESKFRSVNFSKTYWSKMYRRENTPSSMCFWMKSVGNFSTFWVKTRALLKKRSQNNLKSRQLLRNRWSTRDASLCSCWIKSCQTFFSTPTTSGRSSSGKKCSKKWSIWVDSNQDSQTWKSSNSWKLSCHPKTK